MHKLGVMRLVLVYSIPDTPPDTDTLFTTVLERTSCRIYIYVSGHPTGYQNKYENNVSTLGLGQQELIDMIYQY